METPVFQFVHTVPFLTAWPYPLTLQIFASVETIPSQPSFLQVEYSQDSKPFLVTEVHQALDYLCGSPVDSLQQMPVFYKMRCPETDSVLQAWPHKGKGMITSLNLMVMIF